PRAYQTVVKIPLLRGQVFSFVDFLFNQGETELKELALLIKRSESDGFAETLIEKFFKGWCGFFQLLGFVCFFNQLGRDANGSRSSRGRTWCRFSNGLSVLLIKFL